ncbi:phage holin family protein [Salibacteraceae bacterium]|nr:phage holin family protein [Salibacteraceae bacterium]MDC1220203.1 phage holin family protein [bacterium]MDC1304043.1 phage holin family protein [Salibacteraceae bacterium]
MNRIIINILITSIAALVASYLLPGVIIGGFLDAVLVAIALALLNQFVKPLLVIFTIPVTVFTLGLFLLVINAVIILLADWMVLGFSVRNFWWALLFSFILTFVKSILNPFFAEKRNLNRKD